MAKTKISEFSSTPANNTDIDSINIAEGCAPSGINDAIRELMAQLKDFQTGAQGDSFNGPIGTSTAAAGAFTTLSATGAITSTLATGSAPLVIASTTKVSNLNVDLLDGADWASPAALGSTTPAAVSATTLSASSTATLNTLVSSGATLTGGTINGMTIGATTASTGAFTTLAASSTVTLSGGTANGVTYLNGSKVLTSGSALTFDGTTFATSAVGSFTGGVGISGVGNPSSGQSVEITFGAAGFTGVGRVMSFDRTGSVRMPLAFDGSYQQWLISNSEGMRLTSTGLGIGTTSPTQKLHIAGSTLTNIYGRWSNGTQELYLGINSGNLPLIGTLSNDPFAFFSNSLERMRIDSSGRLLVGTSSASGSNLLQVNSDALINGLTVGKGLASVSTNTALGVSALAAVTTGGANVALGYQALDANTTGQNNIAIGSNAAGANQTAQGLIAIGSSALISATSGDNNIAIGASAMNGVVTGGNNVAIGSSAMAANTSGAENTAVGYLAASSNTTGSNNASLGRRALWGNTTTSNNVAIGYYALDDALTAGNGTAVGYNALGAATGGNNTALGYNAGAVATTGTYNLFLGTNSGAAVTTGGKNVIIGSYQGGTAPISATGSNYIVLSDGDANVRATIDSSGNLGIGTTSPAARLHVGAGRIFLDQDYQLTWQNAGTNRARIYGDSGNNLIFENGSGNTERARIDSSGNLLVGATSQFGGADCKLQGKNGSSAQAVSFLWNATTTGDANFVAFGTEATVTQRGSITYNRAGGLTAYNTTSDYRAKDISGLVTDSGVLIDSVPVYMGKMKGATQERPMFIAHETPAYAHTGEKDAVDADGNPVYQQMDASALIPVMWAEIQSLRKRLADAGL